LKDATRAEDICDRGIDLAGGIDAESSPTDVLHQWAEEEHLENVRRLLRPLSTGEAPTGMKPAEDEPRFRFDPPASHSLRVPLPEATLQTIASVGHQSNSPQFPQSPQYEFQLPPQPPAQHLPQHSVATHSAPPQRTTISVLGAFLGFCVVSLGMMGLVCGTVLVGWSLATGRAELWKFGLPTALGGLGVIAIGLLIANLSKRSKPRRKSKVSNQMHVPAEYAASGYATPGEMNASPAVLTELRGQFDILASQMTANNSPSRQAW
jgi:hypothetical protein